MEPIRCFMIAVFASLIFTCLCSCSRTDNKSPGPADKITIAYAALPETALAQIAQARGYYRDEGLDATARMHPYGKLALKDVLEGKADFATTAETPVMFAVLKGAELSIIATIQTTVLGHAVVARKDRGIMTLNDLRGKKIATTFGTFGEFFMDGILALQGLSRRDVKVADMNPEDMPSSLENGAVDAVSTWSPALNGMQKKLGARGITFYNENIYTQSVNIVAKQDFVRDNPGKVLKLLRALISAEEFIRNNPEETRKNVAAFNNMDEEMLRDIWDGNSFRVALDQSLLLAFEDESRWAVKHGLTGATKVPNCLDFIYLDGLASVKPNTVRILR